MMNQNSCNLYKLPKGNYIEMPNNFAVYVVLHIAMQPLGITHVLHVIVVSRKLLTLWRYRGNSYRILYSD